MQVIEGREVSPKKAEYLMYLLEKGESTKTCEIASYFATSPSTITKAFNELSRQGLITHTPYHGARLTRKGADYARFATRRHRILTLMLTQHGFSKEEACREAHNFEPFVSKGAIDRICASFGHPVMGVCGPIDHDSSCCPGR